MHFMGTQCSAPPPDPFKTLSNMEEADVKNEIMERFSQFKFPHYHSFNFPEFQFVKAVDNA